jgi:hypothetical protein
VFSIFFPKVCALLMTSKKWKHSCYYCCSILKQTVRKKYCVFFHCLSSSSYKKYNKNLYGTNFDFNRKIGNVNKIFARKVFFYGELKIGSDYQCFLSIFLWFFEGFLMVFWGFFVWFLMDLWGFKIGYREGFEAKILVSYSDHSWQVFF